MVSGIGNQLRFGVSSSELNQKLDVANISSSPVVSSERYIDTYEPSRKKSNAGWIALGAAAVLTTLGILAHKKVLGETCKKYFDKAYDPTINFFKNHWPFKKAAEKTAENVVKKEGEQVVKNTAENVVKETAEKTGEAAK